jgi:hypothetical protein
MKSSLNLEAPHKADTENESNIEDDKKRQNSIV